MSVPAEIQKALKTFKKIIIVGISANESRASNWIARYLREQGYDVVGVNPGMPTIPGIRVVSSFNEVQGELEIVDIYRSPDSIPALLNELEPRKPALIWLQPGAENPTAEEDGRSRGLNIVSGRCIYQDHKAL